MTMKTSRNRKILDLFMKIVSGLASLIGIIFLAWILFEVVRKGAGALHVSFFTQLTSPAGVAGGVANAILGTFLITILAAALGVPTGLFAGVYLSEFGRYTRLGSLVRFSINVMMGVPSIIVGLFVYTILVLPFGHFSGYAGAVALAIIMMPVASRTTEDMLNLVPNALRESALALGAPRWRTTLGIVFRAAKTGLITGVLLAVARVSGETAPLLFTSMSSQYWPRSLNEPTANLTITIYNYAMSPYADWQEKAWGASLLIMTGVLILTIVARILVKEAKR
ncbi:MAG: phosphate ABC transporter permease PstA [Candidatus Latescibacter sp.]|nr:phosphate ABC transporter permease PstA [Candidatus Latescibacter sp.]